jgi:hypothetical protein
MLWTFVSIMLMFWLIGFVAEIGGGIIHLLLVAAGSIFFFQFLSGLQTDSSKRFTNRFK